MTIPKFITQLLILPALLLFVSGCFEDAQTLSPEPSLLDQDDVSPSCPGLSAPTLSAGPTLNLTWGEASDNLTQASAVTYKIYMREDSNSYDLVSPAKIVVGATTTSISSGVGTGHTYTLFVTCSDEKGNVYPTGPLNEQAITVADTLPPSQITNLNISSTSFTQLLLNWSPSDDGVGGTTAGNMRYRVYQSSTTPVAIVPGNLIATVLSGGTSYLHTGLTPNTTYRYRVVALDLSSNESAGSNEASATTTADTTAPTFAGDTSATMISTTATTSIGLSWTAASDNVTATSSLSYRIYRCAGATTCDPYAGTLVTTVPSGATVFTDTGLSASTIYVYGVRAVDSSLNVSTNTDKRITSTSYSALGSFYAYPTVDEVNIRLGLAVAVANVVGDASGANAFPDLLVGAPNASEAGTSLRFTGCVFVFAGTAVGQFSANATGVFCQPNPIGNGNQNQLNFGSAIAVGDLDLDTIPDVVVTNPVRGTAYIFRTQNSSGTLSIGTNGIAVPHPTTNGTFGTGVCIGNSDGVGALDLFFTTPSEDCNGGCGGGITGTGNVLVYNNTSSAVTFIAPNTLSYRISPTQSLQGAGYSISAGEVVARSCAVGNFDSADTTQTQLVVGSGTVSFGAGAGNDGMVAFYRRTAANTFSFQNVIPSTTPPVTGTQWGNAVATAQVNADQNELVVGAPADSNVGTTAGAVFLYSISKSGANFVLNDSGETYYGGTDFDNNAAGSSVAAADIWNNGSGITDLVIGAWLDDGTTTIGANALNLGQVFTYRNVSGSIGSTAQQSNFSTSSFRVRHDQYFGQALCKGDVNNDGREDLIIGSPHTDYDANTLTQNTDVGSVYVYYGVAAGEIDFANPSQIIAAPGAQNGGRFGYSCVVIDYNADGRNDLAIGSPYRDVVQGDRGAVYLYYGSANTPLPSANSATLNAPTSVASLLFGWSLSKGDFDGNGYQDLAVGMPGLTGAAAATGGVYVFWANSTTQAISSSNFTLLQPPNGVVGSGSNPHLANTQTANANLQFGRAIESFKTVPGSAGVDLIACSLVADTVATYHSGSSAATTDIGNCWIYEGKVNGGLVGDYQIMTSPRNEIRYPTGFSTPANSFWFGAGINKGDWNADTREDLIVCSARQQNLDNFDNLAGGCFIYYGSATGGGFSQYSAYQVNASGTRNVPVPDDHFYNPNAEVSSGSRFGESVLMMDLNNNGSLDFLVGEPFSDNPSGPTNLGADSGRVYIIRGGF